MTVSIFETIGTGHSRALPRQLNRDNFSRVAQVVPPMLLQDRINLCTRLSDRVPESGRHFAYDRSRLPPCRRKMTVSILEIFGTGHARALGRQLSRDNFSRNRNLAKFAGPVLDFDDATVRLVTSRFSRSLGITLSFGPGR
jgi:hypothetical protein